MVRRRSGHLTSWFCLEEPGIQEGTPFLSYVTRRLRRHRKTKWRTLRVKTIRSGSCDSLSLSDLTDPRRFLLSLSTPESCWLYVWSCRTTTACRRPVDGYLVSSFGRMGDWGRQKVGYLGWSVGWVLETGRTDPSPKGRLRSDISNFLYWGRSFHVRGHVSVFLVFLSPFMLLRFSCVILAID